MFGIESLNNTRSVKFRKDADGFDHGHVYVVKGKGENPRYYVMALQNHHKVALWLREDFADFDSALIRARRLKDTWEWLNKFSLMQDREVERLIQARQEGRAVEVK